MKKRILTAAALTLLLCGCSSETEVRNKGFIRTIGSDSGDVQSVTIRLYGQEETLSGSGKTLFAAIDDAETTQGKALFTGHLELLVLDPENLADNLSVMIKNNRISPSCSLLTVPENAAKIVSDYEEAQISDIMDSSSRKGMISKKNISAVLNDLLENDSKAAVPVMDGDKLRMAIINGNSIEEILSEEESEGFCWLTENLSDIYVPIEADGKSVSFHVRKSSAELKAEYDRENIKITTEIKINGSCVEEGISEKQASQAMAEKISGLCSKTISKTVTGLNADVLGIQKKVISENIEPGKSWEEIIPKLRFFYSIKIAS